MVPKNSNTKPTKQVETLIHEEARRKNIPSVEYQSVVSEEVSTPIKVAYERRNRDLDPQLVWRGKDKQDLSDLIVNAPPLYIQERVHPKVVVDDLRRKSDESRDEQIDLFADFDGVDEDLHKTDFYQHEANWSNRMILGDSLQVMASLAEREGLRGQVQCIYFDPPYGIKFNSNFQWSTSSRNINDGKQEHITREPEMVKAFRDTWRDGIHTYLTYLRDRLTLARELLSDTGSIFLQIGDENVHRVRAVMDEVFGDENFICQITFKKSQPLGAKGLPSINDFILWYGKSKDDTKLRDLYLRKPTGSGTGYTWVCDEELCRRKMTKQERTQPSEIPAGSRPFFSQTLMSSGNTKTCFYDIEFEGRKFKRQKKSWKTNQTGMDRLIKAGRLIAPASLPNYVRYFDDFKLQTLHNMWEDTHGASDPIYVVQTSNKVVERCILMATDPGDLVLDPTCGSGTTAVVSEQWGRRWLTIDTSRVALALARSRIMGAGFPYYLLADSLDGQKKEAELTRTVPSSQPTRGHIRYGFVYERVPHITLKSIANNSEIDVIWYNFQETLRPILEELNKKVGENWHEWELPREAESTWSDHVKQLHSNYWRTRIACQKAIDASIAAKANFEYLYDRPYKDKQRVRVAGPFTVESLSPHRTLGVDENDELIDGVSDQSAKYEPQFNFTNVILDNLRNAGVQQAHKEDRINFTSLSAWPGTGLVCAEGYYQEGVVEKRAGIFIGPEFGTVQRIDLVEAAKECGDAGFDVLIACAFNYEAHASEFRKLGRIPVLQARMNADLHMAGDLKNTGKGNLFVIFGEPDIDIIDADDGEIKVKVNGVDVFHPQTGEVRSDNADGIACWFIDTDYNEEAFFVRQAYFLGANDPYKSLKTTLKAEIDEDAWISLNRDISRPFAKPSSGRIAVKVINHLGDEVMKVFRVN